MRPHVGRSGRAERGSPTFGARDFGDFGSFFNNLLCAGETGKTL